MPSIQTDEHGDDHLVDDDGTALGYVIQAPDGALVLHDGESILSATAADGTMLDPDDYELDDGQPAIQDAELYERMAALEAHTQDDDVIREAMTIRQAERDAEDHHRDANREVDLQDQSATVQRILGRPLLQKEVNRLAEIANAQVARGDGVNLVAAIEHLNYEGGLIDASNQRGRSDLVAAMITEHEQTEQQTERQERLDREGPTWIDIGGRREDRAAVIDALADGSADRGEVQVYDSRIDDDAE